MNLPPVSFLDPGVMLVLNSSAGTFWQKGQRSPLLQRLTSVNERERTILSLRVQVGLRLTVGSFPSNLYVTTPCVSALSGYLTVPFNIILRPSLYKSMKMDCASL